MAHYDWDPEVYIAKVENMDDPIFQGYMKAELSYLETKIENSKNKTFIDMGAGYGRVVPQLAKIAKKVIAIEIDDKMFRVLEDKIRQLENVTAIKGDCNKLTSLLNGVENPVLVLFQNSLGTWRGDVFEVLSEMKKFAEGKGGEIVISLFCQESLKEWGVPIIYNKIKELTGEVDLTKTDFNKGIFVSKTGYVSKWWKRGEVSEIAEKLGGKVVSQVSNRYYHILHVSYT